MDNMIRSNPNDKVAIICELNDNRNNTYIIVPTEISLGKITNKGLFQSENGEFTIPNIEDFEGQPSKHYYGFLISLEELKSKYPDITETTMLMVRYFREIASKLNLLLKNSLSTHIYTTPYDTISSEIVGDTVKRINPEPKEEKTSNHHRDNANKDLRNIDTSDLENYLKERIFENDDILEDIVTTIAMNYRAKEKEDVESMLSIGPTGSGKTETYRLIAEYLNVPLTIYDCNLLTSAGYVGKDIEDVFREVFLESGKDLAKAEKSILVFDEIDKIASRGLDVKDLAVQYLLLKVMDGSRYTFSLEKNGKLYNIDSSFMTIAGLGAFSEIYQMKQKKNRTGFVNLSDEKNDDIEITPEDLFQYGMLPELIGRFYCTLQYKKLNADDLRRILLTSKTSPLLRKKTRYLEEFGFELLWEDAAIDAIVDEAIKKEAGGRSLAKLIAQTCKKMDRELLRIEREQIIVPSKKLVLTPDTVHDYHSFKL